MHQRNHPTMEITNNGEHLSKGSWTCSVAGIHVQDVCIFQSPDAFICCNTAIPASLSHAKRNLSWFHVSLHTPAMFTAAMVTGRGGKFRLRALSMLDLTVLYTGISACPSSLSPPPCCTLFCVVQHQHDIEGCLHKGPISDFTNFTGERFKSLLDWNKAMIA